MLRITDSGVVQHQDPVVPTNELLVPRREARAALDACEEVIRSAGEAWLNNTQENLAKLRRFIETH